MPECIWWNKQILHSDPKMYKCTYNRSMKIQIKFNKNFKHCYSLVGFFKLEFSWVKIEWQHFLFLQTQWCQFVLFLFCFFIKPFSLFFYFLCLVRMARVECVANSLLIIIKVLVCWECPRTILGVQLSLLDICQSWAGKEKATGLAIKSGGEWNII